MRLVMTLLVRNAAGILRDNLEFHLAQGVDFFIITDNGSEDCTADLVREYVDAGLAELIYEAGDDYSQWRWVTRMARRAMTHHGADWVINNDDDEYWMGQTRRLKELLQDVPPQWDGAIVERFNHPPVPNVEPSTFLDTMVYRERRSRNTLGRPLPPKICHRAFADVELSQGNHSARRLAGVLNFLPVPQLRISHFPVRDYPSFERKIIAGGAAYARNRELAPSVGDTWRHLYALWQAGGLPRWYEERLLRPEQLRLGLRDGSLAHDESVRRVLRARRAA